MFHSPKLTIPSREMIEKISLSESLLSGNSFSSTFQIEKSKPSDHHSFITSTRNSFSLSVKDLILLLKSLVKRSLCFCASQDNSFLTHFKKIRLSLTSSFKISFTSPKNSFVDDFQFFIVIL